MSAIIASSEVPLPLYLLLLSCFTSVIFRGFTSLHITSILSASASALMIYFSTTTLTSGSWGGNWFQLFAGHSLPLPGIFSVSVDGLSAFFILILGIIGLASSIYGISYIKRYSHTESMRFYSFLYSLFLLSMYLVLTTDDVVLFIISWELMSVAAFFLISYEKASEAARSAALKYLLMSYFGSGLIIIALISASFISGSTSFKSLEGINLDPATQYLIMTLLTVGFGIKAALVPLHSWLPVAHPEAPSNVSALLSGFMIKTAVYGILRFAVSLVCLNYHVLGLVLASLGVISAIYGTSMAIIQTDSKKLMAFSSVGQIGYIFLGIGGGLMMYPNPLGIVAISAGLLHTLNHAVSKGLLFLTAGSIIYRVNNRDLSTLGGLARYMPVTFTSGLIASLSISGIPPLGGFISKWLIILSLLLSTNPLLVFYASLAIFASALTTSAFMKYISRGFLSSPNSSSLTHVREAPTPMVVAQILLASLCVLLGVFFYVPLNFIVSRTVSNVIMFDLSSVNALIANTVNVLAYIALLLVTTILSLAVVTYVLRRKVRVAPTWTFGTRDLLPSRLGLDSDSYYTEFERTYSFSYALRLYVYEFIINPMSRGFMWLIKTYDKVDTYLYLMLVVISVFLTALVSLVVVF